jgi:hypothetical protein
VNKKIFRWNLFLIFSHFQQIIVLSDPIFSILIIRLLSFSRTYFWQFQFTRRHEHKSTNKKAQTKNPHNMKTRDIISDEEEEVAEDGKISLNRIIFSSYMLISLGIAVQYIQIYSMCILWYFIFSSLRFDARSAQKHE